MNGSEINRLSVFKTRGYTKDDRYRNKIVYDNPFEIFIKANTPNIIFQQLFSHMETIISILDIYTGGYKSSCHVGSVYLIDDSLHSSQLH